LNQKMMLLMPAAPLARLSRVKFTLFTLAKNPVSQERRFKRTKFSC